MQGHSVKNIRKCDITKTVEITREIVISPKYEILHIISEIILPYCKLVQYAL